MDTTQLLGYIGALIIGVVMGLVGGGGSILTVPILVYLLAISPVTATAYSLFVVGVSALVGAVKNIQKGLVEFRTAIVFAIPAFISVYLTRKYLVPAIPEELFSVGDIIVTKNVGIMVFFGIIMLIASIFMIKDLKGKNEDVPLQYNYPFIIAEGLVIGVITGIVGAGGGFLIIPALVLFVKLSMKKAIATSLLIIAIKSLIGFIGDIENLPIDWMFLLTFTLVSIIGIFIGIRISNFIDGKKLKKFFGWFVLCMGIFIILKELTA